MTAGFQVVFPETKQHNY